MEQNESQARGQKGANLARRNALGRGLSSLMSVTSVRTTKSAVASAPYQETLDGPVGDEAAPLGSIHYVGIDRVAPNPFQPRTEFPQNELNELADSIRSSGLIQPIIVRRRGEMFEIVAGERRFRASKLAGLKEIPVIPRELSDKETLALGVVENIQRQDLNPIDEALAYQRLIEEFSETQSTVAKIVGRDRVSVANALRLLKLPEEVKSFIRDGRLTSGHGRALLVLENDEARVDVANRIIEQALSVRAVEQLVKTPARIPTELSPSYFRDELLQRTESELMERFRRALGTKVTLFLSSPTRAELRINFFSREELQSFLDKVESSSTA